MATNLSEVDPQWAWSPFVPTADRPWNRAAAAHLHRRAGFGATWQTLGESLKQSPQEVVNKLVKPGDAAKKFEEEMAGLDRTVLAGGDAAGLTPWWLYRMVYSPDPLFEKLTLFWHGHFATSAQKVNDIRMMYAQHQILREHARGKFGPLVHAISRDPAMLLYLDSATNRKTHPNENYAREVMELFCLGTGNYSERDIQELARAFTGWEVHRKKFIFNEYEHDTNRKTILGKSGNFGGVEGLNIVLNQPATARFIAETLFKFFVCDEPAPGKELITPLAEQLRNSEFDIGQVVRNILSSTLFFSEHSVGRKIRSPVELGVGMLRILEGKGNLNDLAERLAVLGQRPFYPPNVKGWDGGRTWINSSMLLGRANLVRDLINGMELEKLPAASGARSPEEMVDWAIEMLVAVPVAEAAKQPIVALARRDQSPQQRVRNIIHAVGTLPEFQLC